MRQPFHYKIKLLLPDASGRKACLEMVPEKTGASVVPVPMELMNASKIPPVQEKQPFLELVSHGVILRVTEQTPDSLLKKVLGVLNHVE